MSKENQKQYGEEPHAFSEFSTTHDPTDVQFPILKATKEQDEHGDNKHVLVVSDEHANTQRLIELVQSQQVTFEPAFDATDALQKSHL